MKNLETFKNIFHVSNEIKQVPSFSDGEFAFLHDYAPWMLAVKVCLENKHYIRRGLAIREIHLPLTIPEGVGNQGDTFATYNLFALSLHIVYC